MTLFEVIISGLAVGEGHQYAIGSFGEYYVNSTLEPDELAERILKQIEDKGYKLVRTRQMAMNDEDRISVNIRSEGLSKVKPTTLKEALDKTLKSIKENEREPSKVSHHPTGKGSTAKRKFKTGVGEEYKREYEEGK